MSSNQYFWQTLVAVVLLLIAEVFAIGLKRRNKVGGADGIRIQQERENKGVLWCNLAF